MLLRVRRHTNGHLTCRQVGEIFAFHAANQLDQVAGEGKLGNLTFLHVTAQRQETAHAQTQNQADRTLQLVHRVACTNQVCQGGEGGFVHQVVEQRQRLLTALRVTGVGDRNVVGVGTLKLRNGANQRLTACV